MRMTIEIIYILYIKNVFELFDLRKWETLPLRFVWQEKIQITIID